MKRIVIKFGGTSVGNAVKIIKAAKIAKKRYSEGNQVIVVVSAMSGVTNNLINKSNKISKDFDKPELDVLLSSGEQISSSLLAGALINLGIKSRSWLGWQVPILTEGDHTSSRIFKIQTTEVTSFLKEGGIPVIAGFQGISKNNRISTIGRGGSDTSALMVAKFFNTDLCEIYTDVKGVYTTDPFVNSKAKKIDKISYEEMLEMSSLGAKVMQPSAVQTAMSNNIPVHVRSAFSKENGTHIVHEDEIDNTKVVTGVTYSKNDAKMTLLDVKDKPGVAANIFEPLGKSNINVDMVVQNISSDKKKTDITFTIKREDLRKTIKIIEKNRENVDYKKLIHDDKVSKVSIIGAGMIVHPGVTYKMFRSLAEKKVNILVISTSEIKISVLIDEKMTQKAVKALHKTFKLD